MSMKTLLAVTSTALALVLSIPSHSASSNPCGSNTLGVSRVIDIDTSHGGRYGQLQYKENDLLRDREVVLTFDDGPLPAYTKVILEALQRECTKATFFVVGRMAKVYPGMVKSMADGGHTIGAHTWSHKNLKAISATRAKVEIERGFSAVREALGRPIAPFFRFPYLSDPATMIDYLRTRKTAVFSIDVDSYDYKSPDPGRVHRNVMRQLTDRGKGIILFHDIQPSTARALPGLLRDLRTKGYKVVHLRAKGQLETLAEYDSEAAKEAKTRLAARPNALEARAITHPLEKPGSPPVSTYSPSTSAPKRPVVVQQQQVQVAPEPTSTPPPTLRPTLPAEEDWRVRVFRTY